MEEGRLGESGEATKSVFEERPRRVGPRRKIRRNVITALIVAVIVAVASTAYVVQRLSTNPAPPSPALGPGIRVTVDPSSQADDALAVSSSEYANVTVEIFSVVPSASGYAAVNLTGANASQNAYDDELFTGTPNSNGIVSGNLSTEFYALDDAWLATMSPMTQTLSLQLYATLAVSQNGSIAQYTYFNNLPYNPRAPPLEFSTVVFLPTHPTFAGPVSSAAASGTPSIPARLPPPSCDDGYYWEFKNSTYIPDGVMPLAIVNASATPSGVQIGYSISYADLALQLSFTSATEWSSYNAYSGLQMSEAPSWSGNDTSYQGGGYTNGADSGGDPTIVGLGGAEVTVTNYQEAHVWGTYPNCHWGWLPVTSTTVQLDGFESGASYDFVVTSLPTYFGSLAADMVDWRLLADPTIVYGSGGVQLYTVMENATGYNSAQSAEMGAQGALSTFGFALGALLLVCTALSLIPGADDVATAAAAVEVVEALTGMATDLMFLFTTISFSATEHTSVQQFDINVESSGTHDNVVANFYVASQAEQLTVGSDSYYPYMPLIYVDVT